MPKHTVNWINDHTQICGRLNERVQLMQDYLNSKPEDFDGIAVKRFLLGQAREQVAWYRQSIDALDFVGCIACRRALGNRTGIPGTLSSRAYNCPGNRAWDGVSARFSIPALT